MIFYAEHMTHYPKKRAAVYTENFSFKIEPELKRDLKELNAILDDDVIEAIRIKVRELREELRAKAASKAS